MMRWKHLALLPMLWLSIAAVSEPAPAVREDLILGDTLPQNLSEFGFAFRDGAPTVAGVLPYALNTPLFSDYAEKQRFAWMPKGKTMAYQAQGVLDFPIGTVLMKSFSYAADRRVPAQAVRQIETRLLIRRATGWVALPYVWAADGRDAALKRAGAQLPVRWIDETGRTRQTDYAVPNANQCKGCHDVGGTLSPIGPKARNLNDGHRLQSWAALGLLLKLPKKLPAVPRFEDTAAPLDLRARAYLDVNCGHCHNRTGPANTSGLWLDWGQKADVNLGIGKRPTAAGRGSGGHAFAIAPGDPEGSYLLTRMESVDPGIAMPEIGKTMVHDEGVALLRAWIAGMKR